MFACKDLLKNLEYDCIQGRVDCMVERVVYDSRQVASGDLFLCVEGANSDGHLFAGEVADKGAKVLVVEKEVAVDREDVTIIRVSDTRYAMAVISAAYFGYPAEGMKIIGVTGTKGKTTTVYLIKSILEQAGHKVGLIGTIEIIIGEQHIPAVNTTPESFLLQKYFREMLEAGCDTVVMEAASQGFKLHRTAGFLFDIGIFTNLEPDHIGPREHADFAEYLACKRMLFKQCRKGIVNGDDRYWEEVVQGHIGEIETYGLEEGADIRATDLRLCRRQGELGVEFTVGGLVDMKAGVATPGRFSVYNALAAIAVCRHFDVPIPVIQKALGKAHVKGRIEMVPVSHQFTLIIDYAHNAMGLASLLKALREYEPERLICLFGCGGNRSKQRRFEMGEVSGNLADLTVITSDNPREEEPQDIIEDIKVGVRKTKGQYVEMADRREAIAFVLKNGQPGDIIVLAGKGHEDYQEIRGVKYPMDERVLIREILGE